MPILQKTLFPRRLSIKKLHQAYANLQEAFDANDFLYITRFGGDDPELRGCSLIYLGNRKGGERVFDKFKVIGFESFLARAYGAWVEGDKNEALNWLKEATKIMPENERITTFLELINQKSFRIVIHSDFCVLDPYHNLPDIDVIETRHLKSAGLAHLQSYKDETEKTAQKHEPIMLPIGQSLASVVPQGVKVDLVLLDDLKLPPVGLKDLGAPVVVNFHDHEWYYEYLDEIAPEVDLFSAGGSSELLEVGHAFGRMSTTQFYSFPVRMPKFSSIVENFNREGIRDIDIVFTGGLTHDFYRDKRQSILPLTKLNASYKVKIVEGFFSHDDYDSLLRRSKFTISSVRATNYLSTRTLDALSAGTVNLVEAENAFPYLFSEKFHCFPEVRHDFLLEDVERHLKNYRQIIERSHSEMPLVESEIRSLMPDSDQERALRYIRHLLFITRVKSRKRIEKNNTSSHTKRKIVHCNDYSVLAHDPTELNELVKQTKSPHWARLAIAKSISLKEGLPSLFDIVASGLSEFPHSIMLHYLCGLCMRLIKNIPLAEQSFENVSSGKAHLLPHDSFPFMLDGFNGLYWFADARIRDQCGSLLDTLATTEDVCKSYALAHRADISLEKALLIAHGINEDGRNQHIKSAIDLAQLSLKHFKICEAAQRIVLRARYQQALNNGPETLDIFLEDFRIACENDYLVLNDCSPFAIHLLMKNNRQQEAQSLLDELLKFLNRAGLDTAKYVLYPEVKPILDHFKIPHGSGYKAT